MEVGSFPVTSCKVSELSASNSSIDFAPSGSLHRDLFTPPIGVEHPSDNIGHTSPGSCTPASNCSASVITAFYSK